MLRAFLLGKDLENLENHLNKMNQLIKTGIQ